MLGSQHKRMGTAAGIGVVTYTIMSGANPALALFMVTTPIGAMLPDIDHDRSKLGSQRKKVTGLIKLAVVAGIVYFIVSSYMSGGIVNAILNGVFLAGLAIMVNVIESNKFIKRQLGFITKHRGIMHTLIIPMFLLGTTLWTSNVFYTYSIYGLCLGYVIHLLGDMATVEGAPILWPLTKANIRFMKLNTGKNGTMLEVVCNIFCVAFIMIGVLAGGGL